MNANRVAFTILAEDRAQANLIRRYLRRLGHDQREIRVRTFAPGSGEQFVRQEFPNEVVALRQETVRPRAVLIAAIDADVLTVNERLRQMERSARGAGIDLPSEGEPITVLVPRRNVETWYQCLCGRRVTEEEDLKHGTNASELAQKAAEALHRATRPNVEAPAHFVDSLRRGTRELRRIEALL